MAEFAASIVAFIQLADGVIRICSHVIGAAKDAPRDMVMISGEVTSLRAILSCFTDAQLHPKTEAALPTLFAASGPIQGCYQAIVALDRLLPKNPADPGAFKKLSWALKEGQVRKLLAEISLHKSTLLLALTGDMMRDIKDIKSGVGRIEQSLSRNERYEALAWLQSKCFNPSSMHLNTYRHHEGQTNSWLQRWKAWKTWLEYTDGGLPGRRLIWIYGIPGSGKSVMASFVVESVRAHCEANGDRRLGYAYYYCHYSHNSNSERDATSSFLRWTVGQLMRQADWAPLQLKALHDSGCDPSVSELEDVLELSLQRFNAVYLVIDGLDEVEDRSELLCVLTELATQARFDKLRLLATSRPEYDIQEAFSQASESLSMSNQFVLQDIRAVVHRWITTSHRMKRWQDMWDEIEERLCEGAQGMFRWVACQTQIIERIREKSRLIEALRNLPRDLHEVYTRVLERIPPDDYSFVRRALLWIIGHTSAGRMRDQGIHIDVLVSAVCEDLRYSTGRIWKYTAEDLKELCSCFITVRSLPLPYTDFLSELRFAKADENESEWRIYKKERADETPPKAEFVKIAHYTVVEFLQSDRTSSSSDLHRQFYMDITQAERDFFTSAIRQALAANPTSTCVDWVRDREVYCLTLAPLIMSGSKIPAADTAVLDLCIAYFLPSSPHFQRLRLIQCYLAAGCEDCQGFYMSNLPIYHPGLPPATYAINDPKVWALLAMIVAGNFGLAKLAVSRLGVGTMDFGGQQIVASFVDAVSERTDDTLSRLQTVAMEDGAEGEKLAAWIRTYRGTVQDVLKQRGCHFNLDWY